MKDALLLLVALVALVVLVVKVIERFRLGPLDDFLACGVVGLFVGTVIGRFLFRKSAS